VQKAPVCIAFQTLQNGITQANDLQTSYFKIRNQVGTSNNVKEVNIDTFKK
jgi:hypothetical protein